MNSPGWLWAPLGAIPPPSVKVHDIRLPSTLTLPYPHVHEVLFSWVSANRPRSKTKIQWAQFSGKYSGAEALRSVSITHTPSSFVAPSEAGVAAPPLQPGTTVGGAATSCLRRLIAWMAARVPGS